MGNLISCDPPPMLCHKRSQLLRDGKKNTNLTQMSCVIHPASNISFISHKESLNMTMYCRLKIQNHSGIVPVLARKHLFLCCVITCETLTHFLKHQQLLDSLPHKLVYIFINWENNSSLPVPMMRRGFWVIC